jgi:hypothetical protein
VTLPATCHQITPQSLSGGLTVTKSEEPPDQALRRCLRRLGPARRTSAHLWPESMRAPTASDSNPVSGREQAGAPGGEDP